jgi:hypothetical protein
MKVRTNSFYLYDPVPMDVWDARTELKQGDRVQVVHLHGCPPPNTMGHAHVYHNGKFAGLVSTASLRPYWR